MKILSKLGNTLADRLIERSMLTPYEHLDGYMERYWLIKPRHWLPFAVRIHRILRSDSERHLHDHPWPYISVILRGAYIEIRDKGLEDLAPEYAAGSVLFRSSRTRHRLVLPYGEVWTLFIHWKKRKAWGFFTPHGKVYWRNYWAYRNASDDLKQLLAVPENY